MLNIQKNLSKGFFAILSLPATAMGFALSVQISALSWILSTKYGLDIHEVGIVWAAGPIAGIFGQVIIGLISDGTWFWGGRRKPFILIGSTFAALALVALPNIDKLSTASGLSLLTTAVLVAITLDLAINISFNPTRSIIADVTPNGPKRTQGYTMMQTISGFFGVLAYVISVIYNNYILINLSILLVIAFSWIPAWLISEPRNLEQDTKNPQSDQSATVVKLLPLFLAHAFCWLGVQTMFVYMTFYLKDVFPGISDDAVGKNLSIGFAILNTVGFIMPAFIFEPASRILKRKTIHFIAMGIMAVAYLYLCTGFVTLTTFYIAMGIAGIGWAATVSLPFAILSDQVSQNKMGFYMGIFNLSVVLPQLVASLVLNQVIAATDDKKSIFLICGLALALSTILWFYVKDEPTKS